MSNAPSRHSSRRKKSRDRIYLECPNDLCDELDKCKEQTEFSVPLEVPVGHRIIRRPHDPKVKFLRTVLIFTGVWIQSEISLPPEASDFHIEACQGHSSRAFITWRSDAHRSKASEQWRQHLKEADQEFLQHRKVRCPSEQCIGSFTSAIRRHNGYIRAQSDRKFRRPTIGSSNARKFRWPTKNKGQQLQNG